MVKATADDTGGKLDDLLASRRFLAFDSKISTELQVDRQVLPMERYQLEVNRRGHKIEEKKLINSNFEGSTLPGGGTTVV